MQRCISAIMNLLNPGKASRTELLRFVEDQIVNIVAIMNMPSVAIPQDVMNHLAEEIYEIAPDLEWGDLGYAWQKAETIQKWMKSRGRHENPITAEAVQAELVRAQKEQLVTLMSKLRI